MQLKTRILNVGDRVKFLDNRLGFRETGAVQSIQPVVSKILGDTRFKINVLGDDGKTYKLTEYNLIAEGYQNTISIIKEDSRMNEHEQLINESEQLIDASMNFMIGTVLLLEAIVITWSLMYQ